MRSDNGRLQLEEDPKAPLPPVALIVEDRDEGGVLSAGHDSFTEMATIYNLTPKNLDRESRRFHEFSTKPKGHLDLDVAHTPLWQALNLANQGGVSFNELTKKKGFLKKPMVLWACGYSLDPGAHLKYKVYQYVGPEPGVPGASAVVNGSGQDKVRDVLQGEEFVLLYTKDDHSSES